MRSIHIKQEDPRKKALQKLAIGALGVVYGDIGTSPLYALKNSFTGPYSVALTPENIVGVLSLFFWSIVIVVVIKYLTVLMRVHNNGEGGIMALLALLTPSKEIKPTRIQKRLIMFGLFGAALLYGDGVITPAVSVLSAVEGLQVATPLFEPVVVPITLGILIALFYSQQRGTDRIGAIFGPAMVVWFASITLIALPWLRLHPQVFLALNPFCAIRFFSVNGLHGFLVLSAVVLCITGAEALYADMGHFGVRPIRMAWYRLVFPALVINYFGQGALLLEQGPAALVSPFFGLVPHILLYPMVIIATAATVIASQALISGAFSLTQQATFLDYMPRFQVVHTSSHTEGQIYIPRVNQLLLISCLALVIAFPSSDQLTGAYGVAVTGTMLITSVLFFAASRKFLRWPVWASMLAVFFFLIVDATFFTANLAKIFHGGWVPILIATIVFTVMATWRKGRIILSRETLNRASPLQPFLDRLEKEKPHRVKGTAVFMTPNVNIAPGVLVHHYKHNKVLHEKVILLSIITRHVPELPLDEHGRVTDLGQGIFQITSYYGYMQRPNVYEILNCCHLLGVERADNEDVSFYVGRETLLSTGRSRMARWRKRMYIFLARNAQPATAFFGIPPDRVIEVGFQLEV